MDLYYLSNSGEKLDFTAWPYLIREHNLHDYEYGYTLKEQRDIKISKQISEYSMTLNIYGDTKAAYTEALNYLTSVVDKDTFGNAAGRLYYGEQYLWCNVIYSEKIDWNFGINFQKNTLVIIPRHPFWVSELPLVFDRSALANSDNLLDYPYGYPYDYYAGKQGVQSVYIDHYADSEFQMTIYGPCANPRILINRHPHEVFDTLENNEYIVVNSRENSVVKYLANGTTKNLYDLRGKVHSLFQKIPSGSVNFAWDGNFGFDLTLYIERSEPRWS